jgi:hypothetical protein
VPELKVVPVVTHGLVAQVFINTPSTVMVIDCIPLPPVSLPVAVKVTISALVGFVGETLTLTVGAITSIDTVRFTALEIPTFPAASYALAVQLCVPLSEPVIDHECEYGEVVSVLFRVAPS